MRRIRLDFCTSGTILDVSRGRRIYVIIPKCCVNGNQGRSSRKTGAAIRIARFFTANLASGRRKGSTTVRQEWLNDKYAYNERDSCPIYL